MHIEGDKAVSVRENSQATIEDLHADRAAMGLAAKDFGSIVLTHGKVENSKKCFRLWWCEEQRWSGVRVAWSGSFLT